MPKDDRLQGSSLCVGGIAVIVAASSDSFPDLSLLDIFEKAADLEFSSVEIAIREGTLLTPAKVLADMDKAIALCRDTHRLGIAAYAVEIEAQGEAHYEQFAACCRLAKATKVACISVPSGELGTPFNEEVEHLRRLVSIATLESAVVSIRTQIGRLSEDPDTVVVLVRQRERPGRHAGSQPLRVRAKRRAELRETPEIHLPCSIAGHQQNGATGSRRSG